MIKGLSLRFLVLTLALALVLVLAPSTVFAQGTRANVPADATARGQSIERELTGNAKAQYDEAWVLYRAGDFAGAILRFERAHAESRNPRILLDIATCERNLGRNARAAQRVDQFHREVGDRVTPADRASALALLSSVESNVGALTFHVTPGGATVVVDDEPVGELPLPGPLRVEAGEHRIRFYKPGFREVARLETVVAGATAAVSATLERRSSGATLHVYAAPGDAISVDRRRVGTTEWTGVLAAGLHVISVTNAGKQGYSREIVLQDGVDESLRVSLEPLPPEPPPKARDSGGAPWLWITGGAALAVGLGIGAYFAFRGDEEDPRVRGTLVTIELANLGRF
jgi:hypothetical protein